MRLWSAGVGFAARCARVLLVVVCAACGGSGGSTHEMNGGAAAHDAGAAATFGNAAGHPAGQPPLTLIDDGGAGVLPDGAIVYLALWARPCPTDSALTYESFGRDFFQQYCLRCHSAQHQGIDRGGAPAGVNFDTLAAIVARKEKIWNLAADENTVMPATGMAPSAGERRMLGDWLACGARSAPVAPSH